MLRKSPASSRILFAVFLGQINKNGSINHSCFSPSKKDDSNQPTYCRIVGEVMHCRWDFQGPPIMGPFEMVSVPYYSHIFRDSYGNSMGNFPFQGVPSPCRSLKIPTDNGNTIENSQPFETRGRCVVSHLGTNLVRCWSRISNVLTAW